MSASSKEAEKEADLAMWYVGSMVSSGTIKLKDNAQMFAKRGLLDVLLITFPIIFFIITFED